MREQDKDKIKKALPEIVDGLQRIIEIPVGISCQLATVNHAFSQISQQITKIHWLAFENLANQYRLLEKDYEKWKEGGTDIFFKAEYPQPDKFIFGLDYCLRSIEIDFTVNNLPGVGNTFAKNSYEK